MESSTMASPYSWRQIPSTSTSPTPIRTYTRPALSSEHHWTRRTLSARELFISATLWLSSPLPAHQLACAVKRAWRRLHHAVPELDARAVVEEDEARLVYHELGEGTQKKEVMEGSVWVDVVMRGKGGQAESGGLGNVNVEFARLKEKLSSFRQEGSASGNVNLLVEGEIGDGTSDERDRVKHLSLMLQLDHQITDGTGTRIILGRLLALLADEIALINSTEEDAAPLMESYKNLSPPWIEVLDPKLSAPARSEDEECEVLLLLERMMMNPGLLLQHTTAAGGTRPTPKQKSHFLTFPEAQTSAMLQAIQSTIGSGANITSLGHTAMVLAMLRCNPSAASSNKNIMYSPCFLNGRRYLKPEYRELVPICMGHFPIVFEGLDGLVLRPEASTKEVRRVLVRGTRLCAQEYDSFKRMKRNMQSRPGPPLDELQRVVADPYFLSDGLAENYIPHRDPPDMKRPPTFTVEDVKFAAHAEENLIVRMSSWRGRTTISGEWRDSDYPEGIVETYLADLMRIMLCVLGEG